MLKNHKILVLLITLTASGILVVLSIWLYGSYRSRQELFLGTAERSLFNVIQNYYQREVSALDEARDSTSSDSRRQRYLLSFLRKVYPALDLSKLRAALDTVDLRRERQRDRRAQIPRHETPDQLLPPYLLEKITFHKQALEELEQMLHRSLDRHGMHAQFVLYTETMSRHELEAYLDKKPREYTLITRPILVNPDNGQFLFARFENPWGYLLKSMGWQVLFSILLLATLVSTFLYLLYTIRKQQAMAEQRKSFVNNMTHELKTPVATVMAAVEAIERFGAKGDKERMERYLLVSKKELEHLHGLVERVLQMDYDETKGVQLTKQDIDIIEVVIACVEAAKMGAKKQTDIHIVSKKKKLFIHVDEAHMKNVVSNLLDNAIKYADEIAKIEVKIIDKESFVEIRVQDYGKGMDKPYQKHIFDMFYRIPEGHIHAVKGFGIGLAYVKQIVEQHGGEITVHSVKDQGSMFTIRIPKS